MPASSINPPKWLAATGVLFATISLLVLLWSANKAVDVTDEGFYLLSFKYHEFYHATFSNFHLIVETLLGGRVLTIVGYRLAYLATLAGQSLVFAYGVMYWLKRGTDQLLKTNRALFIGLFAVFFLAALSAFAFAIRTLSYNSLNSFFIYVTSGLVLVIGSRRLHNLKTALLCLAVGGLEVFALMNKVSSGVILLVWHVLLLLVLRYRDFLNLLKYSLPALVAGLLAGGLLYFACVQPFPDWRGNFPRELMFITYYGYGLEYMLRGYLHDIETALQFALWPGSLLLGGVWLLSTPAAARRWAANLAAAALIGGFVWLCYRRGAFENAYFNLSAPLKIFLVMLAAIALVRFRSASPEAESRVPFKAAELPVLIWLLGLPAVAAYGTANSLLLNMLLDITAWFALGVVLLLPVWAVPTGAGAARKPVWLSLLLGLLPLLYAFQQLLHGVVFQPYMSYATLLEQRVDLPVAGQPEQIRVTPAFHRLVGSLAALLAKGGYRVGDRLIALNDMPGLVYLLGGRSPNAAWFFGFSFYRNTHALSLNKKALPGAFLLVNTAFTPEQLAELHKSGLNYPQDYVLLGQVTATYTRMSGQNTTIRVYAPRPQTPPPVASFRQPAPQFQSIN